MSAQDTEAMVSSMLRDSPLPNSERVNEEIPEDGGSGKLPKRGEGEKLPEGGNDKQPAETPAGKLVTPCRKKYLFICSWCEYVACSSFRFPKHGEYCTEG